MRHHSVLLALLPSVVGASLAQQPNADYIRASPRPTPIELDMQDVA